MMMVMMMMMDGPDLAGLLVDSCQRGAHGSRHDRAKGVGGHDGGSHVPRPGCRLGHRANPVFVLGGQSSRRGGRAVLRRVPEEAGVGEADGAEETQPLGGPGQHHAVKQVQVLARGGRLGEPDAGRVARGAVHAHHGGVGEDVVVVVGLAERRLDLAEGAEVVSVGQRQQLDDLAAAGRGTGPRGVVPDNVAALAYRGQRQH
ncbi:hypothetical protein VTG60DRAFT_2135 [Thermothelomyces hinnuleus]